MSADIELKWEWPGERAPQSRFIVAVESLHAVDGGFFGFKKSPSLVSSIPDPMELKGKVMSGDSSLIGKEVFLTLPKLELGEIKSGDLVAMGVLNHSVCICIKKVSSVNENLDNWNCQSE